MAYDPQNTFARILRGEAPCVKVLEDEQVLAFMDLMPQADGHTLVVPKAAAETILELAPASAAACINAAQRLAPAILKAVEAEGLLIVQVNGSAAGQAVPHVHFHLIPRWAERPLKAHATERANAHRLEATAARIVAALRG
jgi:histidine triad (HIT) family protein